MQTLADVTFPRSIPSVRIANLILNAFLRMECRFSYAFLESSSFRERKTHRQTSFLIGQLRGDVIFPIIHVSPRFSWVGFDWNLLYQTRKYLRMFVVAKGTAWRCPGNTSKTNGNSNDFFIGLSHSRTSSLRRPVLVIVMGAAILATST